MLKRVFPFIAGVLILAGCSVKTPPYLVSPAYTGSIQWGKIEPIDVGFVGQDMNVSIRINVTFNFEVSGGSYNFRKIVYHHMEKYNRINGKWESFGAGSQKAHGIWSNISSNQAINATTRTWWICSGTKQHPTYYRVKGSWALYDNRDELKVANVSSNWHKFRVPL